MSMTPPAGTLKPAGICQPSLTGLSARTTVQPETSTCSKVQRPFKRQDTCIQTLLNQGDGICLLGNCLAIAKAFFYLHVANNLGD
jgi:hypothetical protein